MSLFFLTVTHWMLADKKIILKATITKIFLYIKIN